MKIKRIIFKEKEIIKEVKRKFLNRGTRNPSEEEIEVKFLQKNFYTTTIFKKWKRL